MLTDRENTTNNFSTGLLAVGERNHYGIPQDWITVDIAGADFNISMDENTTLPFEDNSVRVVYSTHCMEHLTEPTLKRILSEIRRILHPNGVCRIEVPDAEWIVNDYLGKRECVGPLAEDNRRILVDELGFDPVFSEEHIALSKEFSIKIKLLKSEQEQ